MSFKVGQRWVSQTEPKLGLGIVSEFADRRLTITFPAAGEVRTYAMDNAPVSRVSYKSGDVIQDHEENEYTVQDSSLDDNLMVYQVLDSAAQQRELSEVELNCFIQFTSPLQRLVSGHYDRNRAFRLRYETIQHLDRIQQSPVRGLLGSRTSLLPHQVYIADSVAQRYAPRVLLADEVGLGKTIEAGMIMHAQLQKGLGSRMLVCVPSTLIYQWLVEMLRRFNLRFSIFDEDRYDALIEEGIENPFESEQLILTDLKCLLANDQITQHAAEADWDLFVVDEAHHLEWSSTYASPEYLCVESIAEQSQGVLLLTATPEQAGKESHFARLRLLDPDRFHDLEAFKAQESHYGEISQLVSGLQESALDQSIEPALKESLLSVLGEDESVDWSLNAEQVVPSLIQDLLDLHGTGRILFRNTRHGIEGFPARVLNAYKLDAPAEAVDLKSDPRVVWLTEFLASVRPEKVLVICASAGTALELESYLRLKQGLRTAAFYEGLTIIERDRAAAYFADREEGAQALICSEIGSEGRNFQFAHNLVLFDLPENPDLLEQRIGRLDRIGQLKDVNIHVPYITGSRQEGLYHWYHKGLNAFEYSCSAGYSIQQHFDSDLAQFLEEGDHEGAASEAFLVTARAYRDEVMAEQHRGRDPLLELNSCRMDVATHLIELLEQEENSQSLSAYMNRVFSLYGVEQEQQSDGSLVIHPGEHMLTHDFPYLTEDGCTLTFHRLKALVREDIDFITWEHPMVTESIEQLLSSELGNAALAQMSVKGVPPGTLFIESIFSLNSMAPKQLQLDRFLPMSPQRIVVNVSGRDLSEVLPHEKLNELCSGIKRSMAHAVVKEIRSEIAALLGHAQAIAEKNVPGLLEQARTKVSQHLEGEIHRLRSLQQKNPLIRDQEITFLENQKVECLSYIDKTGLEVQALRVIINT
jgi:ATP-dependent helicase HepA